CSQWSSCETCVLQDGCGFCGSLKSCIQGGWFGPLDTSICALNDFYYHQCHLSSLPWSIIATILISITAIAFLGCCLCCCLCRRQQESDDTEENRPLLVGPSRYLRRTSTYYQWNRVPVNKQATVTTAAPVASSPATITEEDQQSSDQSWEDRRKALIKKYAREPPTPA
ncbi:hypothetical protein K501DRAFT_181111, partial [Backusella circina FSU 941]